MELAVKFGYSNEETVNFAETGNRMIFNDAFPKLRALNEGSVLNKEDAQNWDAKMLSQEQNLIQPFHAVVGVFHQQLSRTYKRNIIFN